MVERRKVIAEGEVTGLRPITSFFVKYPAFEENYLKWAVNTFQPLCTIEDSRFRKMCQSLAPDCPVMSKLKVMKRLLQIEQNIKCVFRKALKGQHVSVTLDHWTSNANVNYVAQTAHFITEDWKLSCFTLACSIHKGGSSGLNSEEVGFFIHPLSSLQPMCPNLFCQVYEGICKDYEISLDHVTAVVTDSAKDMNAFGRLITTSFTSHHNCLNHCLSKNCYMYFSLVAFKRF